MTHKSYWKIHLLSELFDGELCISEIFQGYKEMAPVHKAEAALSKFTSYKKQRNHPSRINKYINLKMNLHIYFR